MSDHTPRHTSAAALLACIGAGAAACAPPNEHVLLPQYTAFGGADLKGYVPIPCFTGDLSSSAGVDLEPTLYNLAPLAEQLQAERALLGGNVAAAGQRIDVAGLSSNAAISCNGEPAPSASGLVHASCIRDCSGVSCDDMTPPSSTPAPTFALFLCEADGWHALSTTADVANALGPIDSPEKAWFWTWANGYDIACSDPSSPDDVRAGVGDVRSTASGYQVMAFQDVGGTRTRFEIAVSSDGTLTVGRTESYSPEAACFAE